VPHPTTKYILILIAFVGFFFLAIAGSAEAKTIKHDGKILNSAYPSHNEVTSTVKTRKGNAKKIKRLRFAAIKVKCKGGVGPVTLTVTNAIKVKKTRFKTWVRPSDDIGIFIRGRVLNKGNKVKGSLKTFASFELEGYTECRIPKQYFVTKGV
jgi:hypothetical protein